MPVMDGIEALKRIREKERQLPIILCSAYGEYKQDLTTWASDAYVVKCADLTNSNPLSENFRVIMKDKKVVNPDSRKNLFDAYWSNK